MTTNTVLDDAEARIAPRAATGQTARQEQIESMRQEIGEANYMQAPVELAKLEALIGTEIRPFLARLASIAQRAKQSLPHHMQAHCNKMDQLCAMVPNTIRAGIDGWDKLTPPIWKMDGKSLDLTARAQTIHEIRFCLRNWDGAGSRLKDLKTSVENYIRDSHWPAGQSGTAA